MFCISEIDFVRRSRAGSLTPGAVYRVSRFPEREGLAECAYYVRATESGHGCVVIAPPSFDAGVTA